LSDTLPRSAVNYVKLADLVESFESFRRSTIMGAIRVEKKLHALKARIRATEAPTNKFREDSSTPARPNLPPKDLAER
jgi:hypothetical protein